eukprot:TRINITY_DN803_c0_g1_i1.p1 TRINITY_DN803_c0_g1~~TRINITY_DN803_c0_g1_i1.p1  ORF type:complete len:406 (-),score=103.37 TRINITY_DN803_c0_g1_i1:169-1386(-)
MALNSLLWLYVKVSATLLRSLATIFAYIPRFVKSILSGPPKEPKKQIIVVGSGFSGAFAARTLQYEKDAEVTLVTPKPYFVFTPGILTAATEPEYAKHLQSPLKDMLPRVNIVVGKAVGATNNLVHVEKDMGGVISLPYNIMICASGSRYAQKRLNSPHIVDDITVDGLARSNHRLEKAKHILIIGGGIVGVELAAEIVAKYGETKFVHIVHAGDHLCQRLDRKVSDYIQRFLYTESKMVSITCNRKIVNVVDENNFVTDHGEQIYADLAYFCAGPIPNTEYLEEYFGSKLTQTGHVRVNQHLQMEGVPNVFVAGDVAELPEEKMAAYARMHSDVVAANVSNLLHGRTKMQKYHSPTIVQGMLIGLVKKGILVIKGRVLATGAIPAYVKAMFERFTMIYHGSNAW